MNVYLLILRDDPYEILSAWSTLELATKAREKKIKDGTTEDRWWLDNRLDIETKGVDVETRDA